MDRKRLPELICDLYQIVGELEAMFPGRHFTPDGHLVGSLGECLAAYHYSLELMPGLIGWSRRSKEPPKNRNQNNTGRSCRPQKRIRAFVCSSS